MGSFFTDSLHALFRPTALVATSRNGRHPFRGIAAALLLGTAYAALYGWLSANGHRPSMTRGLPISADAYYGAAALYSAPLVLALMFSVVLTVHGLARTAAKPPIHWHQALHVFGMSYAIPLLTIYLIPDLVTYGAFDFAALAAIIRYTGPLAALWVATVTYKSVRTLYGTSRGRALASTLTAALAQAIPAAVLLR